VLLVFDGNDKQGVTQLVRQLTEPRSQLGEDAGYLAMDNDWQTVDSCWTGLGRGKPILTLKTILQVKVIFA
jgi:hypothetical protein